MIRKSSWRAWTFPGMEELDLEEILAEYGSHEAPPRQRRTSVGQRRVCAQPVRPGKERSPRAAVRKEAAGRKRRRGPRKRSLRRSARRPPPPPDWDPSPSPLRAAGPRRPGGGVPLEDVMAQVVDAVMEEEEARRQVAQPAVRRGLFSRKRRRFEDTEPVHPAEEEPEEPPMWRTRKRRKRKIRPSATAARPRGLPPALQAPAPAFSPALLRRCWPAPWRAWNTAARRRAISARAGIVPGFCCQSFCACQCCPGVTELLHRRCSRNCWFHCLPWPRRRTARLSGWKWTRRQLPLVRWRGGAVSHDAGRNASPARPAGFLPHGDLRQEPYRHGCGGGFRKQSSSARASSA